MQASSSTLIILSVCQWRCSLRHVFLKPRHRIEPLLKLRLWAVKRVAVFREQPCRHIWCAIARIQRADIVLGVVPGHAHILCSQHKQQRSLNLFNVADGRHLIKAVQVFWIGARFELAHALLCPPPLDEHPIRDVATEDHQSEVHHRVAQNAGLERIRVLPHQMPGEEAAVRAAADCHSIGIRVPQLDGLSQCVHVVSHVVDSNVTRQTLDAVLTESSGATEVDEDDCIPAGGKKGKWKEIRGGVSVVRTAVRHQDGWTGAGTARPDDYRLKRDE
mmetsp:Transcript_2293/g.4021  ORF Transcript_2293/g.4021 Transcript_2293/m.4021 type:complete len:275 (-) Transcript_2293:889-1713(-)